MDRYPGTWSGPAAGVLPAAGECHVWVIPVTDDDRWPALLDPAERERANGNWLDSARRTFIASRAVQRLVGARYLGCAPTAVAIRRSCERCGDPDHGRPQFVGAGTLDYSVSHSGEWLMMAVVSAGRVGIDLERMRELDGVDDITASTFAPAERTEFEAVPTPGRLAWFYRVWTRKEAVVKLTGHGLGAGLRGVDVRGPVAVVTPVPQGWPADPLHLRNVPAPSGYVAALAHTRQVDTVRLYPGPAGQALTTVVPPR